MDIIFVSVLEQKKSLHMWTNTDLFTWNKEIINISEMFLLCYSGVSISEIVKQFSVKTRARKIACSEYLNCFTIIKTEESEIEIKTW